MYMEGREVEVQEVHVAGRFDKIAVKPVPRTWEIIVRVQVQRAELD